MSQSLPGLAKNFIPPQVYEKVRFDDAKEEIRLLKVVSFEPIVECELEVMSLRRIDSFAALSYTWKNALHPEQAQTSENEGLKVVRCNGVECYLLENLFDALAHLGRRHDQELFWVDAICIHQSNLEEKTSQVQLMSAIYQKATSVLVWLGKADDDTDNAKHIIDHLGNLEIEKLKSITADALESPSVQDLLKNTFHDRKYWVSLARFLRRTWFTRAWVVQEVILASPDSIFVYSGDYKISWPAIRAVSGWLSSSPWRQTFSDQSFLGDSHQPPRLNSAAKIGGTQDDIMKMTKVSFSGEPHDLFLDTLIRVREFDCEMRRDKAYCCYGIGMRYRPRGFPFPKPEYRDGFTDADAFTQTAQAVLQMSQSLHLLAYAESRRSTDLQGKDTMPSWVPDWSVSDTLGLGVTGYRRYWAAANLTQIVEFADVPQRRILRLRAAEIDQVAHLGNSKGEIASGADLRATREVIGLIRSDYRVRGEATVQGREEVLWRTLVTDTCPGIRCPALPEIGTQFRPWLHQKSKNAGRRILEVLNDLSQATTGASSDNYIPQSSASSSSGLRPDPQRAAFANNFGLRMCLKLFVTDSGLLGSGAEAIQPKDSLWIVPGSRVPLVMRRFTPSAHKYPNRYQLVGAAYVHGLMHGEALMQDPPLNFQTMIEVV